MNYADWTWQLPLTLSALKTPSETSTICWPPFAGNKLLLTKDVAGPTLGSSRKFLIPQFLKNRCLRSFTLLGSPFHTENLELKEDGVHTGGRSWLVAGATLATRALMARLPPSSASELDADVMSSNVSWNSSSDLTMPSMLLHKLGMKQMQHPTLLLTISLCPHEFRSPGQWLHRNLSLREETSIAPVITTPLPFPAAANSVLLTLIFPNPNLPALLVGAPATSSTKNLKSHRESVRIWCWFPMSVTHGTNAIGI